MDTAVDRETKLQPEEGQLVTKQLVRSWTEALAYAQGATRSVWEQVSPGSVFPLLDEGAGREMMGSFQMQEELGELRVQTTGIRQQWMSER